MTAARIGQVELAYALNVSQAAVSQWLRGKREPSAEIRDRLERSLRVIPQKVEAGPWIQPIILPGALWRESAFSPRGEFILPEHINWTGTRRQRTFDARKLNHLLYAYTLVITNGEASDFARWIDPEILRAHFDEIRWSRGWKEAWSRKLEELEATLAAV